VEEAPSPPHAVDVGVHRAGELTVLIVILLAMYSAWLEAFLLADLNTGTDQLVTSTETVPGLFTITAEASTGATPSVTLDPNLIGWHIIALIIAAGLFAPGTAQQRHVQRAAG
jgi:hypothetical protein